MGFPKDRTEVSYLHAQLVQNNASQTGGAHAERERAYLNQVFELKYEDDRRYNVPRLSCDGPCDYPQTRMAHG